MPPKRPNFILPSHIPNVELDVLIRDGLDVEANSGNGSDVGVEFKLIKDCYRPASVSPDLRKHLIMDPREMKTHWSFLRHLSLA